MSLTITSGPTLPSKEEWEMLQNMAKAATESKYFEKLGGIAGITSIALYARELGIPVMGAVFGGLQNVMGKISMSPEMMNSLIRRDGHKIEIMESTDFACKIKGIRKDTGEVYISVFTIDDAKKAGLIRPNSGWDKYPSDMLFARCISRLRRRLFPDIASKSYVEGEVPEKEEDKPEVIEVNGQEAPSEAVESKISKEQALEVYGLIGDDLSLIGKIQKSYGIDSLYDMPSHKLEETIKKVKQLKEKSA